MHNGPREYQRPNTPRIHRRLAHPPHSSSNTPHHHRHHPLRRRRTPPHMPRHHHPHHTLEPRPRSRQPHRRSRRHPPPLRIPRMLQPPRPTHRYRATRHTRHHTPLATRNNMMFRNCPRCGEPPARVHDPVRRPATVNGCEFLVKSTRRDTPAVSKSSPPSENRPDFGQNGAVRVEAGGCGREALVSDSRGGCRAHSASAGRGVGRYGVDGSSARDGGACSADGGSGRLSQAQAGCASVVVGVAAARRVDAAARAGR